MGNNLYWITDLAFLAVLLIIIVNDYLTNRNPNKQDKAYRVMVLGVIFYCLQDAIWGLCDAKVISSELIFFISSEIFHLSCVFTTFFWLYFFVTYLNVGKKYKLFFYILDLIVIGIEVFFAIKNIKEPCLFRLEDGNYYPGKFRQYTFYSQYIFYLLVGVICFIKMIISKSTSKKKYFSVFIFTLAPILLGICQLLYPHAPFFSMGYFFGVFITHIFIVSRDHELKSKNRVLNSIANIYYSIHIFDLKQNTTERILESDLLTKAIGKNQTCQEVLEAAMTRSVRSDYLKSVLDFCNVSTLNERMKERNTLSLEFVGYQNNWYRSTIIGLEKNGNNVEKIIFCTQNINEEKQEQLRLQFESNNDELTGLYNRRAFSNYIEELSSKDLDEDLVVFSLDLNGLKVTNDKLGHAAGDEIIEGAARCISTAFSSHGKCFRVGGDEFSVIINCTKDELKEYCEFFEETMASWSGKHSKSLTISYGFVRSVELENPRIKEMLSLADKRMYLEKSRYYKAKGINRRQDKEIDIAYRALCKKILKVNLTKDTYEIVHVNQEEQTKDKGFETSISKWLKSFALSGMVHKDDLQEYLNKTDLDYLRNYFKEGNKRLSVCYRRKEEQDYSKVVMDLVTTPEYSDENQNLYLYVK